MSNFPDITPEEYASQLKKPNEEMGSKVGFKMNVSNKIMTDFSYQLLNISNNERGLEIGIGNGRLLSRLFEKNKNIFIAGIDYSPLMVEEARAYHKNAIENGLLEIKEADIHDIPYPDAVFDKACSVNTIYFWHDPIQAAKEVFRVLKPEGEFCLSFRPKNLLDVLNFTRFDEFKLYEMDEIMFILESVGFEIVVAKRFHLPYVIQNNAPIRMQGICILCRKNY